MLRALDEAVPDPSACLLAAVHQCCLGPALAEKSWKTFVQGFVTSPKPLAPTASVTGDFLIWDDHAPRGLDKAIERRNTYEHLAGGRSVMVDLATIAEVKGETQDANLVLTTPRAKCST